jgi:hypothetical protein
MANLSGDTVAEQLQERNDLHSRFLLLFWDRKVKIDYIP